jgi:hypothetical protein
VSTFDSLFIEAIHKIQWGDVPTWGATGAAVVAGYFALRALRYEQERNEEHDLKGQAERVGIWLRPVPEEDAEPGRVYDEQLVVANLSDMPITDVLPLYARIGR